MSKEMKFVKAKELVVATPAIEKVKFEKKAKSDCSTGFNKASQNHQWLNSRWKENLFRSHKEDHKLNIFAIIVESEDTLDPIATSFKH